MLWLFFFCLCTTLEWFEWYNLDFACKTWPGMLEVGNEKKTPLHPPPFWGSLEMSWSEHEWSKRMALTVRCWGSKSWSCLQLQLFIPYLLPTQHSSALFLVNNNLLFSCKRVVALISLLINQRQHWFKVVWSQLHWPVLFTLICARIEDGGTQRQLW